LAAVALLLAVGGVYVAVTFSLSQGARDLGVRLALGAGAAQLIAFIYGRYARLAATGVLAGAAAAVWLSGILNAGLSVVEVGRFDPLVFTAVLAFCFVVVLAAILPPARRALRIDSASLLRTE
jgi:ABC-type antimicrobial peptide transport system, permease component